VVAAGIFIFTVDLVFSATWKWATSFVAWSSVGAMVPVVAPVLVLAKALAERVFE
jgi:hypothetical protein